MASGRGRKAGSPKTGGRKAGTPNKLGADVKAMILGALEANGGMEYLSARAKDQPVAFMALVGKVLPMTVQGDADNPVKTVMEIRWASDEREGPR